MHWRAKSLIQRSVASLPDPLASDLYYRIQRRFGGLRRFSPFGRLVAGVETWKRLLDQGSDPSDCVFLEVGTGRAPIIPLSYWLMGAKRVLTMDLNVYVRPELVVAMVRYVIVNPETVATVFGSLLRKDRWEFLRKCYEKNGEDLDLSSFGIEYLAPSDATSTGLPTHSVDFHTSYTVLEHIPPATLTRILIEGGRVVRPGGLFCHLIDYTDHFSHSDDSLSVLHFLRYSDRKWKKIAGNRFMYANRLRHDDLLRLYQDAGHNIRESDVTIDESLKQQLDARHIPLSKKFANRHADSLAITHAWVVSEVTR